MRLRTAVATLAVATLALPTAAGATTGQALAGQHRIHERWADAQTRETPAEDLLAGVLGRDRTELGARSDALRSFLAETWGSDDTAVSAEEPEPTTGAVAWSWPAGDLTGDGLADVLVDSWTWPGTTYRLEARRGSDGTELWAIETTEWDEAVGWPSGRDLTGDGAHDLLVWTWSWDDWDGGSDCSPIPVGECTTWEELTYSWTLGVRSGRDGTLVWSQTYEGGERWEHHRSRSPLGFSYTDRVEATNALALPYLAGDDLVLNVLSGTWESSYSGQGLVVLGHSETTERMRATTHASIVDGATGTFTSVRTIEDAPRVGWLRPADQAGSSLLWWSLDSPDQSWSCEQQLLEGSCSAETSSAYAELEMLDGQTFVTRWQRPVDVWAWIQPVGADLDGDGHAEVLVERWWYDDEDDWGASAEVVSGADGVVLWERDGWWWPRVVGSLDGSPGADLLVGSVERAHGEVTARAERLDGATGATLLTTSETIEIGDADDTFVWFWPVGDVTGDGVVDLGWEAHRVWWDEDCGQSGYTGFCWYWPAAVESVLRVESTRTGATLRTAVFAEYAELWPAGDLDGDGAGEVLEIVWDDDATRYTAIRPTADTPLWTLTLDGWSWVMPAGDQTGDGASEVLVTQVLEDDNHIRAEISSHEGPTAAKRWSLRYGAEGPSAAPPQES